MKRVPSPPLPLVFYYCQHVLGMGHYFRSLEICRHLRARETVMLTGGAPVAAALPDKFREFRLPGLMMDEDFSAFYSTDPRKTVAAVQAERIRLLQEQFAVGQPDLLVVELYPFGRKAFRFELEPILKRIRQTGGGTRRCRVVCSLRDILVEKTNLAAYEQRVVEQLNRWFDLLLIHADPSLVPLEQTFSRLGDLSIPYEYTGFVAPRPSDKDRRRIRRGAGIDDKTRLIVASAGGGKVGGPLLEAAIEAFDRLPASPKMRLQVFTGPFLEEALFTRLQGIAGPNVCIERFTPDFLSWLAAADLSVSMGGYNTCMNILAARVPAIVWPFAQNREQSMRVAGLADRAPIRVVRDTDLAPHRMALAMEEMLARTGPSADPVDLNGAPKTADCLHRLWQEG